MDILGLEKMFEKKDGACTVGVDKFKNFLDYMAKATIIASNDDKLKKDLY